MRAILYRVDGGQGVGLGHVQRCLSLAAATAARGLTPAFLVNDDRAVADRITRAGWRVDAAESASWSPEDLARLLRVAAEVSAEIVVVDSDVDPPEFSGGIREAGLLSCTIDDESCDDVRANVLVNGDAHANQQRYSSGRSTTFLLGPEFAMVSPRYLEPARPARVPARSALLTLGGSDPLGLFPSLVSAVADTVDDVDWEIVVGPFIAVGDSTASTLETLGTSVRVTRAPDSMFDSLQRADVALTAAGQTLYEAAVLGRPAVAFAVAENQVPQLEAFVRQGTVISAGDPASGDVAARALAQLRSLMIDPECLRVMGEAGRRFIDGHGTFRVIDRLLAERARGAKRMEARDA